MVYSLENIGSPCSWRDFGVRCNPKGLLHPYTFQSFSFSIGAQAWCFSKKEELKTLRFLPFNWEVQDNLTATAQSG